MSDSLNADFSQPAAKDTAKMDWQASPSATVWRKRLDLVDGEILVEPSAAPELPEGIYYHFEILDSEVYTDEGQRLGVVVDILKTGAHDVYVVQEGQREYFIPVTVDIVRQIDRMQKRITIHPLEGLLDL